MDRTELHMVVVVAVGGGDLGGCSSESTFPPDLLRAPAGAASDKGFLHTTLGSEELMQYIVNN